MKRKYISFLLILSLFLQNACTVRTPMTEYKQPIHNSAERIINPYYSVKKKSSGWVVIPVLVAGAIVGGYILGSTPDPKNPKTSSELHKQGIGGAAGLAVLTFSLAGGAYYRSSKNKRIKTENVSSSGFDQWLNDYSRKEKQRYIKYQGGNNGYLIIPQNKVAAYEAEEKRREEAEAERKRKQEEDEKQRLEQERALALSRIKGSPKIYSYFEYKDTGNYWMSLQKYDQALIYYSLALYFHNVGAESYCTSKINDITPLYKIQQREKLANGDQGAILKQVEELDKGINLLIQKKYEAAYQSFRIAADLGSDAAQTYVGIWLKKNFEPYSAEIGVVPTNEFHESLKYLEKAGAQNNPIAQTHIAYIYDNGLTGKKDYSIAASWYRKAADQGFSRAQLGLGYCYYLGDGITKNEEVAMGLYKLAVNQGSEAAVAALADFYERRLEDLNLSDVIEASDLLLGAATAGHPNAMRLLGLFNTRPFVKGERRDEGLRWLTKAAELGDRGAQFQLGYFYRHINAKDGSKLEKESSYKKAVIWLERAVSNQSPSGMTNLGDCYYDGAGVDKNLSKALELYKKAAKLGSNQAKHRLDQYAKHGYVQYDEEGYPINSRSYNSNTRSYNSNTRESKTCSACSGRGYVYSGDNRRESCYVCGGSGKN